MAPQQKPYEHRTNTRALGHLHHCNPSFTVLSSPNLFSLSFQLPLILLLLFLCLFLSMNFLKILPQSFLILKYSSSLFTSSRSSIFSSSSIFFNTLLPQPLHAHNQPHD